MRDALVLFFITVPAVLGIVALARSYGEIQDRTYYGLGGILIGVQVAAFWLVVR